MSKENHPGAAEPLVGIKLMNNLYGNYFPDLGAVFTLFGVVC